jgi:hypothetical protein
MCKSRRRSKRLKILNMCRIAAEGKVCLINVESAAAVVSMRAHDLKATYVQLCPTCEAFSHDVVQQIGCDPPLVHVPEHAESMHLPHPESDLQAAQQACMWDVDLKLPANPDAAYYCLMEAVATHFPMVVPQCHVWGFGRQLWDRSARVYGRHPLCVLILGPTAVGKTTIAMSIAERFGLLHINAGNLLFDEVRAYMFSLAEVEAQDTMQSSYQCLCAGTA